MSEIKNIVGQRFGRLIVIKDTGVRKNEEVAWLCRCDCGSLLYVRGYNLRSGQTRSCGCLLQEKIRTHGESKRNKLYKIWLDIKQRCSNKKMKGYRYYGGKGITVCPEWQKSYLAFKNWAFANGYQEGLTIDRLDSDGNYEPSNCRWITRSENARKANIERWHKSAFRKSSEEVT